MLRNKTVWAFVETMDFVAFFRIYRTFFDFESVSLLVLGSKVRSNMKSILKIILIPTLFCLSLLTSAETNDVVYEGNPLADLSIDKMRLKEGHFVQETDDGRKVFYTPERNLQLFAQDLLDRYEVPAGAAVVLRTSEVCRYPKEAVDHFSQTNPVLHHDLMKQWQKELTDADAWLTKLSTGSAKKRMANLLLRLAEDDSTECFLFSREDIGSILSITIETASRTISEFKRQNLIKEIRSNHFDLDIEGLTKVVES